MWQGILADALAAEDGAGLVLTVAGTADAALADVAGVGEAGAEAGPVRLADAAGDTVIDAGAVRGVAVLADRGTAGNTPAAAQPARITELARTAGVLAGAVLVVAALAGRAADGITAAGLADTRGADLARLAGRAAIPGRFVAGQAGKPALRGAGAPEADAAFPAVGILGARFELVRGLESGCRSRGAADDTGQSGAECGGRRSQQRSSRPAKGDSPRQRIELATIHANTSAPPVIPSLPRLSRSAAEASALSDAEGEAERDPSASSE
jgi:hypothetical protein